MRKAMQEVSSACKQLHHLLAIHQPVEKQLLDITHESQHITRILGTLSTFLHSTGPSNNIIWAAHLEDTTACLEACRAILADIATKVAAWKRQRLATRATAPTDISREELEWCRTKLTSQKMDLQTSISMAVLSVPPRKSCYNVVKLTIN